jgi:hypothetical protein
MTNLQRRRLSNIAYACFLCCGAGAVFLGLYHVLFLAGPMRKETGLSFLAILYLVMLALPWLAAFGLGAVVTLLLRGPPALAALTGATALLVAIHVAGFGVFGLVLPASTFLYAAMAIALPLVWFYRWRKRLPADS